MESARPTPAPPTSSIRQVETSGAIVKNPTEGEVPARFVNKITEGPFRKSRLDEPSPSLSIGPIGAQTP